MDTLTYLYADLSKKTYEGVGFRVDTSPETTDPALWTIFPQTHLIRRQT